MHEARYKAKENKVSEIQGKVDWYEEQRLKIQNKNM